jgi:hypothetical protein
VRALQPETRPRVLVSDTVGFIKKLPHDLVASFRSTLAEALEASLLLFVVDASDPTWESQLEVSRNVLKEIGADTVPSRLLLNKMDRVSEQDRAALRAKHPARSCSPRRRHRTSPRYAKPSSPSSRLRWWRTGWCCPMRSRDCSAMSMTTPACFQRTTTPPVGSCGCEACPPRLRGCAERSRIRTQCRADRC